RAGDGPGRPQGAAGLRQPGAAAPCAGERRRPADRPPAADGQGSRGARPAAGRAARRRARTRRPMIEDLFENNIRWAAARARVDPEYFRRLAAQQSPDYLWVGCSDSRVPANEIVGLDPGELFVHRNFANLAAPQDANFLSVLQFALEVLKVRHVI